MNRAIVLKTLRDCRGLLIVLTLAIILFEMVVQRFTIDLAADLDLIRPWLEMEWVRQLVTMALGADPMGDLSSTTIVVFGLAHPAMYALTWILILTVGTGVVAGEIGRGTADLLLTLPVSRTCVYVSVSAVLAVATIIVSAAPVTGLWLGACCFPMPEALNFSRLWLCAVNWLALNIAVAGTTMLVSSVVSRRGPAVGVVLGVLIVSDVINFVTLFWEAAQPLSWLGFLHYYRLLPIVRGGGLPSVDIAVLLGIGLVTWGAGLWCFRRRDIPAL